MALALTAHQGLVVVDATARLEAGPDFEALAVVGGLVFHNRLSLVKFCFCLSVFVRPLPPMMTTRGRRIIFLKLF